MKRALFLMSVALILLIPISTYASQKTIPTHTPDFYINDFADVLNDQAKQYIMEQSIKLDELTDAQLVVVTVDTTGDIPLEDYSLNILREWGIGSKDKNNGVLILIAVEDRKSRIEVGYGLEGALPDSKTGRIQDDYMLPHFSTGDYSSGILEGYKAILLEVYNEYGIEPNDVEYKKPYVPDSYEQPSESESSENGLIIFLFIIGFLLFDSFFLGGRILRILLLILFTGRRGGPRGGGRWGGGGWSGGGGGFKGGGGSGGGGGSSRGW